MQGLAWDAGGRLYATEFGQNTFDEVNLIEAGGTTAGRSSKAKPAPKAGASPSNRHMGD